jgi:hypothetical protein
MASKLVPDFEVKLLLQPSEVLSSNNNLKDDVRSTFSIPSSSKKMNIQFIDTDEQSFYTNGWVLRIRKTEGDKKFELTYKKRYPVNENYSSTAEGKIDAAVAMATNDGFNSTTRFEAQVEIGYHKQTLSISHDEKHPDKDFDREKLELPLAKYSSEILASNAPEKLAEWLAQNSNPDTDHLAASRVYGPVLVERFKGIWNGETLSVEVWPIRKSKTDASIKYLVEASFKTPSSEKALDGLNKLAGFLQKKGWFLPDDSLKTKLIMERY